MLFLIVGGVDGGLTQPISRDEDADQLRRVSVIAKHPDVIRVDYLVDRVTRSTSLYNLI